MGFKDRWPRFARHVNGFTAWAYWLGWFPVAPLNMILASFYITEKFNLSQSGFTPIHTPIAYWTIIISVVGILLIFIPAWLGIRLGAMFATVLGLLSMIPLTLLAIMPFLHPSWTIPPAGSMAEKLPNAGRQHRVAFQMRAMRGRRIGVHSRESRARHGKADVPGHYHQAVAL